MTEVLEILLLLAPLSLNRLLQTAQITHNRLQRITAAAALLTAHLVQAILHHAAKGRLHQPFTFGAYLINRLMVERQPIFTVFNDAVHLLFQLTIQRGQAITHVAVGTQFFNNDLIQCRTPFLQT